MSTVSAAVVVVYSKGRFDDVQKLVYKCDAAMAGFCFKFPSSHLSQDNYCVHLDYRMQARSYVADEKVIQFACVHMGSDYLKKGREPSCCSTSGLFRYTGATLWTNIVTATLMGTATPSITATVIFTTASSGVCL